MIHVENITFTYPHQPPVFEGFDWHVARGEVWAVLGPSACGKSTLLMLLAGLLQPQAGGVTVAGEPLRRPRPCTGLILQDYGLLPWATVRENAMLGLRIRHFYGPDGRHVPRTGTVRSDTRTSKAAAYTRVDHWLARLGIAEIAGKYPAQISGGQRQRTAIARTFALHPDLLLMDEPFSALDAPTREALQMLTLNLCAEVGLTVVLVTHSIEEAAFVGQKILVLGTPPNHESQILDNLHAAGDAYRRSEDYHAMCALLRERVGDG